MWSWFPKNRNPRFLVGAWKAAQHPLITNNSSESLPPATASLLARTVNHRSVSRRMEPTSVKIHLPCWNIVADQSKVSRRVEMLKNTATLRRCRASNLVHLKKEPMEKKEGCLFLWEGFGSRGSVHAWRCVLEVIGYRELMLEHDDGNTAILLMSTRLQTPDEFKVIVPTLLSRK